MVSSPAALAAFPGKQKGHPLEGCCQEAHPSLGFFSFLFLPARFVTYSYAPLFSFGSVSDMVRTSHPSGSRHGRMLLIRSNDLPAPGNFIAPENCRYHAVSKVYGFTNPMAPHVGVQHLSGSRRGRTHLITSSCG